MLFIRFLRIRLYRTYEFRNDYDYDLFCFQVPPIFPDLMIMFPMFPTLIWFLFLDVCRRCSILWVYSSLLRICFLTNVPGGDDFVRGNGNNFWKWNKRIKSQVCKAGIHKDKSLWNNTGLRIHWLFPSVADLDPGSRIRCLFDPRIRYG